MSNSQHTGSGVVPPFCQVIQMLWIRSPVTLCCCNRNLYACSWFFGQNMTFASPKNIFAVDYIHESSVIGSPWDSIWWPSGLVSVAVNTELYCICWRRSHFECSWWTWVAYVSNALSIKTILFDISDFWYQPEEIRFVKTLSKRRMFVSFMKISACWLLHRLIKFNKFVEKRDVPNHGQTCGHRFADMTWKIPKPTLMKIFRYSNLKVFQHGPFWSSWERTFHRM